ncbi:dehydrogenase/reductase SDR family member 8 [Whalleya microplaca]|nr:dehydrogenase/reductase SDR family member 8 [Whalleya microplaca]
MPMHKGFLPREGLVADPFFKLVGRTALNPVVLLPLLLLGTFTKTGENLTRLHPLAFSRVKTLFYVGLTRWLSSYWSGGVVNNWEKDIYDWPNEIAVVTGGAGGIGGHVVRLLAEQGLKVVVLDIQPMTFEAGPNVYYFKCDLTSTANLAEVANQIRDEVGEPTILVNNAGVARGKTILGTTEADLKFTFDVNLFAHYRTVQEFLPHMVKKNHGMVVTIASYAAWITVPNMVDYGATKAAATSFHEGLAAELKTRYSAPKVRTVLVNQGYTKTALFTGYHNGAPFLSPTLEPESVAEAICKQIFTGKSGQVVTPAFGNVLQGLSCMPHWYSYSLRAKGETIMRNFNGRQVIKDIEKHYHGEGSYAEAEGSTVIVPELK